MGLHRKRLETHMKQEDEAANEEEKTSEKEEMNKIDLAVQGKSFSSLFKSFLLDSGDK